MRNKYLLPIIIVSILINLLLAWLVLAGNPDSPGAPNATSSYTLQDLYNRLTAGTAGSQSAFTEPSSAPGVGTMRTLNEIMAVAPALDNTHGATTTNVLAGQTFWGLTASQWATQTGAMPNNGAVTITPGTLTQTIAVGYHNGSGYVEGDADLVAGNIRSGTTIFGVTGSLAPGAIAKRVAKTGQTQCWDNSGNVTACAGTGQDGEYQMGIDPAIAPTNYSATGAYNTPAWTGERFTDNGDGTVTDNLTTLVWLKNANCWGAQTWANALSNSNGLASGSCGLSDDSSAGDWRLPNINELHSLIDLTQSSPALPSGHPFSGVQVDNYWSSTTFTVETIGAWIVVLDNGIVGAAYKEGAMYVWPVRGGQ